MLERPGYVPVNAPRWAAERTSSTQVLSPSSSAPQGAEGDTETDADAEEDVFDLIALRDQTRRAVNSTINDAEPRLRLALDGATSGVVASVRNELETHMPGRSEAPELDHLLAEIRSDLGRATAENSDTIDHMMKAIDQLALQLEADRATSRAGVEGLDRLARRVSRLHSA